MIHDRIRTCRYLIALSIIIVVDKALRWVESNQQPHPHQAPDVPAQTQQIIGHVQYSVTEAPHFARLVDYLYETQTYADETGDESLLEMADACADDLLELTSRAHGEASSN